MQAFDAEEFRRNGHAMIDFIADNMIKIQRRQLPVRSSMQPGYLRLLAEDRAPELGVPWGTIMDEMRDRVLPGVTHWSHPDFFAFFPAMCSNSALLGNLLADSFNQPGFNWMCSPVASEMEALVTDWLVHAMSLPPHFLMTSEGGAVIQPTATESVIVAVLAAKHRTSLQQGPVSSPAYAQAAARLVVYFSEQAHFCVEKAAKVVGIAHIRKVPAPLSSRTKNYCLDVDALADMLRSDVEAGLLPCLVSASVGTTGTCAIDDLEGVAALAKQHSMWFNVDAAYAGVVAVCPEMRHLLAGVETADSLVINGSKWFSMAFNTSFMFFKRKADIVTCLNTSGVYLENKHSDAGTVVDYKDLQLGLGRPFRSLKVYVTLKHMGLEGIRGIVRSHIHHAQRLHDMLQGNSLFDMVVPTQFALVCFRLAGVDDACNKRYLDALNDSGGMFLVHTVVAGRVVLRLSLAYPKFEDADVLRIYHQLSSTALQCIQDNGGI
jgi:glutamate/tyrosine decarboxylase-like PLP-dependent enzyme